jgi:hypothetical protein
VFTLTHIAFHKVKEVGSEWLSPLDVFEYLAHVDCLAVRGTVLLNVGPRLPLVRDGCEDFTGVVDISVTDEGSTSSHSSSEEMATCLLRHAMFVDEPGIGTLAVGITCPNCIDHKGGVSSAVNETNHMR